MAVLLCLLPAVQKFLAEARSKGATVVHSIVANTTTADIRSEVGAAPNEAWVQSEADKFMRSPQRRSTARLLIEGSPIEEERNEKPEEQGTGNKQSRTGPCNARVLERLLQRNVKFAR